MLIFILRRVLEELIVVEYLNFGETHVGSWVIILRGGEFPTDVQHKIAKSACQTVVASPSFRRAIIGCICCVAFVMNYCGTDHFFPIFTTGLVDALRRSDFDSTKRKLKTEI